MAAVGLTALLRKILSPASNFGYTVFSTLVENPVLSQRSPKLELPLQSSGILCRRSVCSWSPLQSPASEFAAKGKAICPQKRAKTDKNLEAEENGSNDKCTEGKSNGGPFEERQIAAARSGSPLKKGIKSMDYTEEKVAGTLLNDRYRSGDLTGEVEKPSVYVTSDYVDHRGMQLVFLGTSSSIPTWNRSTSCIALRLEGSIFLFDCGEGAVRQILRTPVKHYDISNIFITHLHGDHIYGLPGLLCRIGLKEFQSKDPIHIYGPQGLRQWIRSTLNASHARVHPKYVVHEMILKKKASDITQSWNVLEENHADELPGKDIRRSASGLWHIYEDDRYKVTANFLRHTIPCWGYVVEEHPRRGRFQVERALEAGVKPGRYFRMLETGQPVTLACGKVVSPSDVLGPPRRGRKVVILGDTCDPRSMVAAAKEADVVVHEATVLQQDALETSQRGHSTAEMAGEFARTINAGTLVLTHFSRKLDGAVFVDERSRIRNTMEDLVSSAQRSFGKPSVIAAEDFMAITIQLVDKPPVQLGNKGDMQLSQKGSDVHGFV
ncbi:unnamed protein product [Calypogeia fissa]